MNCLRNPFCVFTFSTLNRNKQSLYNSSFPIAPILFDRTLLFIFELVFTSVSLQFIEHQHYHSIYSTPFFIFFIFLCVHFTYWNAFYLRRPYCPLYYTLAKCHISMFYFDFSAPTIMYRHFMMYNTITLV